MLTRRIKIQLAVFAVVALVAGAVMVIGYFKAPATLFGVDRYTVTVQLRQAAGLYERANVTYRGTEVGHVEAVRLTDTGVDAVLSLRSNVAIPSDLDAAVHSQSAVGEQYIALTPRGEGPPLKNGDVIPTDRTSVPPDVNELLNATNVGLEAIPGDNLQTVIDEAYTAIGGLGPEIRRFVQASTELAIDGRDHLDSLTALIDRSAPVLDTQTDTAGDVRAWARNIATVTESLRAHDSNLASVLQNGPAATDEARMLFERLRPTLPIVAANLASVADVAVVYQPAIEQLLVVVPHSISTVQGLILANHDTKQDYTGSYLDFHLNLGLPPTCTTGFLPTQQRRATALVDYPDRPDGDIYCRVPQDSQWNVRGVRNYPCLTRPGKRAPTVKLCESDEQYVPLNEGFNWKGDPNATLSGQDIPQQPPPPPPLAVAEYNPATGQYVGPDGQTYTQSNLAHSSGDQTWQSMLLPPEPGN